MRRFWVASPQADPFLIAAARGGVILTCVTQAERLSLWIDERSPNGHVACNGHAGRIEVATGTKVHRSKPIVPRHPESLEDRIENVLALVAECRPFESALAIWESALNKKLVELPLLQGLPFKGRARLVREAASPYSDSGLESFVMPRLRWLRVRILPQTWVAGHRVDFLIGDRLALQIDGGHHVGAQREQDIRHDAALTLMGYHVIRVGYTQVMDDWPSVQNDIMLAVAQGLHLAARRHA